GPPVNRDQAERLRGHVGMLWTRREGKRNVTDGRESSNGPTTTSHHPYSDPVDRPIARQIVVIVQKMNAIHHLRRDDEPTARPKLLSGAIFQPIIEALAHRPFVVAQLGQSLDGRIATMGGDSRWINGASALDHLHRLRDHVDAVVVGIGTIIADD